MNNNQLTIKFGGDGNINVETLTQFLQNYKEVLYQINKELGYGVDDLIVEVSPPEDGSFKINVSPKYKKLMLQTMTGVMSSTLAGLIVLHVQSGKEEHSYNEIKTILADNNISNEDVQKNVYHMYQNTGAKQNINQTFITINNDENITDLKINQGEVEFVNVPKSEFKKHIHEITKLEENELPVEEIEKTEVTLIIKTIHFEGHAKWAFIYRGYSIKALIKDEAFLKKLSNEAFMKGDSLRVILSKKKVYDNELETYIVDESSYIVDDVLEHKSKHDNQSKLDI